MARGYFQKELAIALVALAGCAPGTFLSESGPTRGAVIDNASRIARPTGPTARTNYVLVDVNETVISWVARKEPASQLPRDDRGGPRGEIGVGDIIGLTVFESDSGGLFLPREPGTRAGNYVTLPNQQVDRNGDVVVPYAGKVRAIGLSPATLQGRIEQRLAARAVEPQVVVSIVDRRAGPVSVLGEVARSANFTLDPNGETLLGAIARAGGPKYPAYESVVTLQRAGKTYRLVLADIARNPKQNIQLRSGDTVFVAHEPRYFIAMGAIGQSGSLGPVDRRLSFQDSKLNLIDALGRAGGLNDNLANAQAVFIYRFEPRTTIASYGVPDANYYPPAVPTVYMLNLTDPAGFFHASRFPMRSEDIVYVANAPATDLQKFLGLLGVGTGSSAAIRATVK